MDKMHVLMLGMMGVFTVLLVSVFFKPGITGMATGLVSPLCTADTECSEGTVCCMLEGQSAGVCDFEDNCDSIAGLDSKEVLYESPKTVSTWFFYTPLLALFIMVIVMIVVFFKTRKELKSN